MTEIKLLPNIITDGTLSNSCIIPIVDPVNNALYSVSVGDLKAFVGGSAEPPPPPALEPAASPEFWIEGSLEDLSGNNRDLVPVVAGQAPLQTTGMDGKPCLQWPGNSTGELQAPFFMDTATAATLFVVFTANEEHHYNLIQTGSSDDFWRFGNTGNGYIGTFVEPRIDDYPQGMPGSGSHLAVLKAGANYYEFILDNVSKGPVNRNFAKGDRFRVGTNSKNYKGSISAILCYSRILNAEDYNKTLAYLKDKFPSLPFTL